MRAYSFRLQSVLEYRKKREETELQRMACIMRELDRERRLLEAMDRSAEAAEDGLVESLAAREGVNAEHLRMAWSCLESLRQWIKSQTLLVKSLEERASTQMNETVEAAKDRKCMERLKANDYQRYLKRAGAEEQGALDEMGITGFHRRKGAHL